MDIIGLGTILCVFISCIFIFSTWDTMYRKRNLPPGPTPLPLIGNLLQLDRNDMVKSLIKLWKQYGPVYTIYFGPRPTVVICGYQAVKEALVDRAEDFGGRGNVPVMDLCANGYGVGFSNGNHWKQMRMFTLKTFRDFGMGKKSLEGKIQEEAECLVEELRKFKDMQISSTKILMNASANVLCSIVFGQRFEYGDKDLKTLLGYVEETFRLMNCTWGQMLTILPKSVMSCLPGPHQRMITISEKLHNFVLQRVKANQETLNPSSPRDYIDCFLIKMEQEKNDPNTEFNTKSLLWTVHNLFIAGTESISSTMTHGFLILLKYPEIQAKLKEEINQVIGQNRLPNSSDKLNMPYTDAFINELHRWVDIAPFNVTHTVTKVTHFRGYTIPKDTDIFPILCSVHCDPSQFATPYKFNPGHFLNEDGKFKKNEGMMAFSAGKRVCVGEGLARMEIFLFLTTILQNFTLTSQTEFSEADMAPQMMGLLNFPIPYKLSFVPCEH
ncbi:cytochrome P450 2G1-like [Rhinophrynus dorsalis]